MERTLEQLKPGDRGIIKSIGGLGKVRRRLMEMGVTKGTEVNIEKVAPLGDPIEIKVKGYNLSLRKSEASQIVIE
ncbi:FeoA family protein [Clostridium grantii]|uniref:Ferrous iron transport protein A n=1 Tax=Clostridium grantii DSM 8605 TaxID=1121316 RepID=A0A1M5V4A3_9CLOT|nr:FeoA family protein [Clostridium grantii]SHH70065.1 ferrous iron transport protein A [Clostridium grantii DSM 8605]